MASEAATVCCCTTQHPKALTVSVTSMYHLIINFTVLALRWTFALSPWCTFSFDSHSTVKSFWCPNVRLKKLELMWRMLWVVFLEHFWVKVASVNLGCILEQIDSKGAVPVNWQEKPQNIIFLLYLTSHECFDSLSVCLKSCSEVCCDRNLNVPGSIFRNAVHIFFSMNGIQK